MQETIKLVGYGVDTLILIVRYADKQGQPVKQELDEKLAATLDYLQSAARAAETAVASDWSFLGVLLFVEPRGAGKQWRWLLTCRMLSVTISRGCFYDLILLLFGHLFWCGSASWFTIFQEVRNCRACSPVRIWYNVH